MPETAPVNVLEDLGKIISRVLDRDGIVLVRETTAKDVDDWDSLNHIQIVVAIEKHFQIKFTSAEIMKWKNAGEMCDSIQQALAARQP